MQDPQCSISTPDLITSLQINPVELNFNALLISSTFTPNFKWNFTRKVSREADITAESGTLSVIYSIAHGRRSQVLIIPSVQWWHDGVYTCIVSSGNSQIQAEANLNVLSK